jgi:hypothetical protein
MRNITPRVLLYAGAVAAAGGLVVAGRSTRVSGACLVVAGLLFVMAARVDVARTYAPSEMPRRTTRLIHVMVGAVGVVICCARSGTCGIAAADPLKVGANRVDRGAEVSDETRRCEGPRKQPDPERGLQREGESRPRRALV